MRGEMEQGLAEPTAEFLTEACREALRAIRGKEAAKKRATVLLLASAAASGTAISKVFKDPRACSEGIWYTKWQYDPAVKAALELLKARALEWCDQETARTEAYALQERRKKIALFSLDALDGLRTTATNSEDRADHRTEASAMLLALADEELAARIVLLRKGATVPVEVEGLDALIEHELARVAATGEGSVVGTSAGDVGAGQFERGGTSGPD